MRAFIAKIWPNQNLSYCRGFESRSGRSPNFFFVFVFFQMQITFHSLITCLEDFVDFLKAIFGDILWNTWNNQDLCWETAVNERKRKKYFMKSIPWDDTAKTVGRPACCPSNKNASSYYYYSFFFLFLLRYFFVRKCSQKLFTKLS